MSGSGGGDDAPLMVDEGIVRFGGCRIWYRVVGDLADRHPGLLPVLTLHGGSGLPHDSLEPLEDLAHASGRPVVFYDQLGCGDSERHADPDAWNVGIFLEELAAVRLELGLDAVHLLGHSWGGLLAMEHALSGADGLASLVLVGAVASGEKMLANRQDFYDGLPAHTREAIRRHEESGTAFDDPGYAEAMDVFHKRYSCRLDPSPDWLDRALAKMDVEANAAMSGLPDSPCPLRAWDLRPRLGGIDVPTLIMAGRYDGMTAGQERDIHAGIPDSELVVFKDSSHYPFAEEGELFLTVLDDFLTRAESSAAS